MFCKNCGNEMGENRFCPNCGADGAATADADTGTSVSESHAAQSKESGLKENTAGLLCYVLGWLTGLIFFFMDKRPFVRFHAAQSLVTFGAISVFTIIFNKIIYFLPYTLWSILRGVDTLISIGSLVLAIYLMIQAHKGNRYKLPMAGDMAERLTGKIGN